MKNRIRLQLILNQSNNAGFTLVELVVVLVLMTILMAVTIFGGLGWQDWMRFQHEDSVAEEIYYAAQNQLIELEASGSIERSLIRPLKDGDSYASDYILAEKKEGTISDSVLRSITGESGERLSWSSVWKTSSSQSNSLRTNTNQKDSLTIVRLSAKKNSYQKYLEYKALSLNERREMLNNEENLDAGTVVLFDLIASYISDVSALNGAIILEFSPETRQVFSALYSDQASELGYSNSTSATSVLDRQRAARESLMLGYYGTDQLTESISGEGKATAAVQLEIRNDEMLSLVLRDNEGDSFKSNSVFEFAIYDGDSTFSKGATPAMTFRIPYDSIPNQSSMDSLLYASENPMTRPVNFKAGKYNGQEQLPFRFPVWMEDGDIHIVLDAADIQAQSGIYKGALSSADINSDDAKAFRNTYSFYRFGLFDLNYIYASVKILDSEKEMDTEPIFSGSYVGESGFTSHEEQWTEGQSCGECTTFASFSKETTVSPEKRYFELTNARHLYNIRYETEYKGSETYRNSFLLKNNIDWNSFTNKDRSGRHNFFLNSYDYSHIGADHVTAGIEFNGYSKATGVESGIPDTADMPFPSFRCLGTGDSLRQESAYGFEDEEGAPKVSYTIKNLNISFAANVLYGIYDDVFLKLCGNDNGIKESCMEGHFSILLGLAEENASNLNNMTGSDRSGLSLKGVLPLGLFCENLGTMENITLDAHVVRGMEAGLDESGQLVYTCMVGGFAGNNLGIIRNLTLLSSDGTTHINGRKDVGGIIGRQSFVVSDVNVPGDVVIENVKNYGQVTGMENVGGIVGRVYVNYVGENDRKYYVGTVEKDGMEVPLAGHFHDGYYITDEARSMTDKQVIGADSVQLIQCENYGMVSGDDLLSDHKIDVVVLSDSAPEITGYVKESVNNRCAFIGGIVGAAMDGLMYNGSNVFNQACSLEADQETKEASSIIRAYFANPPASKVVIEECKSIVLYSDEELSLANEAFSRDYYVGGIVGYSRLAELKGIDLSPDESFVEDGVPGSYVLGCNYVGGIAGCSDMTKYTVEDGRESYSTGKIYCAVNYNNVIGRKFVGGIAGAFGVGADQSDIISFRDPASNDGGMPSGILGDNRLSISSNLLNTGIVLALKTEHGFQVGTEEANASYACGGVAGATAHSLYGCDNIQTEAVKEFLLDMISDGRWKSIATDVSVNNLELVFGNTMYGGCAVGGIVGWVCDDGKVNPGGNAFSYIDAVIFGEDFVGGAIGYASTGVEMSNCYPYKISGSTGMYVLGTDIVGGILGDSRGEYTQSTGQDIQNSYYVYGRYAVGGVAGRTTGGKLSSISLAEDLANQVSINGGAYVGGCTGIVDDSSQFAVTLRKMDINGKYFVGGAAGAVSVKNENDDVIDISFLTGSSSNYITADKTVHVEADAYAGGVAGIFACASNSITSVETTGKTGALIKLVSDIRSNGLDYPNSDRAYGIVVEKDVEDSVTAFSQAGLERIELEFLGSSRNTSTVEADIFAGGLFGYVPDKMPLTIKGYKNQCSVHTTGYVGRSSSAVSSADAYDSTTKISYLGGVIGRVQSGMILQNCENFVSGMSPSAEGGYYYSDKARYLGGLTEVNAGIIQGETKPSDENGSYETDTTYIKYNVNRIGFDYSLSVTLEGVGAFAGINGTKVTDGENTGVIRYCSNKGEIKAKNAAGIAAAVGGKSVINYSENRGSIYSTDDTEGSASGIAGVAVGGISNRKSELGGSIKILNCVNLGDINPVEEGENVKERGAGIVYDTGFCGDIEYCRNYGPYVEYAITGTRAAIVNANAEVGGLGADKEKDPVGPSADVFERNFFLYGSTGSLTESDLLEEDHWSKQLYFQPAGEEQYGYTYIRNGALSNDTILTQNYILNNGFKSPFTLCSDNTMENRELICNSFDIILLGFLKNKTGYSNDRFVGTD